MNLERLLIVSAVTAATAGLFALTDVGANATRQGDGTLAQEPMHLGTTVAPNFIMAIDDSGSMTFQTMLPAKDGAACWNGSFYDGTALRTSGSCNYHYVLPGPRAGSGYYAIPPLPQYAFARSPDVNPSYYDPDQTYTPWVRADGTSFGPMDPAVATPIHPNKAAQGSMKLFETFKGTASTEYFRVQDGMYIPKDVEYALYECIRYEGNRCRENGWVWRTSNGFTWGNGATNVAFAYTPAMVYLKTATAPDGYTAVGGEIKNACGTDCSLWGYTPSSDKTKVNFANWFAYYGNRNRAMIAGLTLSLRDISTDMRVGYFTINSRDGQGNYAPVTMRETNDTVQKQALMNEVLDLGASGGTPNRFAVDHIGKQFDTNTNVIKFACQKNAGMLFTDGYSNTGGPNVPDPANADLGMGVPFSDGHSSTLADIAAYYYNKPLRGTAAFTQGMVPVANPQICEGSDANAKKGVDCNKNPHMNFYGVTLGARGKLFGVTYGLKPDGTTDGALATQQALALTTSPAWEARTDDNPNTVDELWHATMNARGQYINAQTPADITTAMRNVLASVGVGAGVSGSLAITGSRLGVGSLSVVPRFDRNGTDWYGDIDASRPKQVTDANGKVSFTYTKLWSASGKLPEASARTLYYGTTGTTSKPTVANFYSAGPSSLAALCANYPTGQCGPQNLTTTDKLEVTASQAVQYLAGDPTLEGTKLRRRTTRIGDIVNSTPIVSAGTDDYGYALLRKSDGSFEYDPYDYTEYLDSKKNRKPLILVGANDGMMHAFNGETGVEQFGYIPAAVVGYMGNLLFPNSPDFQHRYYVDGPVVVSDARFGTTWKTVAVGTTGAGARSVFGLDVTSASSFTANDVLWEVNDKIAGAVGDRIGYVLGKPVIVPVRGTDGRPVWKAIFGGGYGNRLNADAATLGTVTLFIVDMQTGDVDYIDAKDTTVAAANGLGNIVAIDRYTYSTTGNGYVTGSDGMVDVVYGGDLQGNVWKFDLTATSRVAFGGKPLFTAKGGSTDTAIRQPITGGLEAAVGPRGGVMVLFGTGSFSFQGDKQNKLVQTMYGVLDAPGDSTHPMTRANLQPQSMNADGIITNTTVNYYVQRGWYLDLGITASGKFAADGERAVGYPKIEGGILYFTSYSPAAGDDCSGGGSNYLYGLSTLSGGGALGIVKVGDPNGTSLGEGKGRLGLTTDGSAPVKDVSVFTTGKQSGLSGSPDDDAIAKYDAQGDQYCMAIVSVAGSQPLYRVRPCGRQSWRQIR